MPFAGMQEIIFECETPYGKYRDALYFPDNQPLPSEEVIEAIKLERANNWVAFIENKSPPETDEVTNG